jgi:hypothetical protein
MGNGCALYHNKINILQKVRLAMCTFFWAEATKKS